MLDLLKRGRDEFDVVAVKAEFEAEGTRPDELHRLLEIAQRADIKVALKIGGCEAVSDLHATKVYGIDYVIAPMVETAYALSKYVEAKDKTHGSGDDGTDFLFNLETETSLLNLHEMLPVAAGNLQGIVFGRVDFTLSCGLPRSAVNDRRITDAVLQVARCCRDSNLELVLGGSVSVDSIGPLREVAEIRLDRFETRKIVFDGRAANRSNVAAGIGHAAEFELAWLKNKRDSYQRIAGEDITRIAMLETRSQKARPVDLSATLSNQAN